MDAKELATLKAELRQLPESSTPKFPYGERRQLVADLLEEILFLRQQGYSYSEISDLLNEKTDVLIRPKTLRRYFFEEQAKQRGTAARTKRSQTRRSRPAPSTEELSTPAIQPDSSPVSAPEPAPLPVAVKPPGPEPALEADKSQTQGDKTPTAPEAQSQSDSGKASGASPVETVAQDEDHWGGCGDDDDDDSYTTGLIHEPTFNRIRRR